MAATLRNAVKRRTHKERPQPASRRRLGLLEKKKDYKRRADDHHRKEKALQVLQRKAEERNPDEFYFAMQRGQTKQGVHSLVAAQANSYSHEELLLMKSQDASYLALKASVEAKKLDKLRGSLHSLASPAPAERRHTFFADDAEEAATLRSRPHTEQPQAEQLEDDAAPASSPLEAAVARRQAGAYKELQERTERHQKLQRLAQRSVLTRHLMGPGNKSKQLVKGADAEGTTANFKWKPVRLK